MVIFSMATSSHEDAPRGMSFLYNLNRLNVATSRARRVCVLVGSPVLFESECRTPEQMEMANASMASMRSYPGKIVEERRWGTPSMICIIR